MNVDIIDGDILAASRTTQNVVVSTLVCSSAGNIPDHNVLDQDTCSRVTCWATVQVVLLDVDSIDRDVLNTNVLKQDVVDVAGGVLVGLDAGTVLGVQDNRVAEDDVCDVVVRLAADRTNGKAMTTVAVHVVHDDVVTAGDRNTVILVDDYAVANFRVVSRGKVEAVTVVRGGKSIRTVVGCVAGTVVECDVVDIKTNAVADIEAMNRVVLDVDIVD
jgi:hypothetical protein